MFLLQILLEVLREYWKESTIHFQKQLLVWSEVLRKLSKKAKTL